MQEGEDKEEVAVWLAGGEEEFVCDERGGRREGQERGSRRGVTGDQNQMERSRRL